MKGIDKVAWYEDIISHHKVAHVTHTMFPPKHRNVEQVVELLSQEIPATGCKLGACSLFIISSPFSSNLSFIVENAAIQILPKN